MLNKNVCPKCGQLYDLGLPACPVCNTPAQVLTDVEQPVQRKRLTEVERRERQQAQRREAAEARRREREERRAADAEEERLLEEEEERLQRERRRKKLEKRGLSEEEINQKLDKTAEKPTKGEADMKDYEPKKRDPARVPAAFSAAAILLLLIALVLGGSFLLWRYDVMSIPLYDRLSAGGLSALTEPAPTECESIAFASSTVNFDAAGQTHSLSYTVQPEGCEQPVTFRTSDESVAMVGELGIVTAVGPGSCTIIATCGQATASCTVICEFAAAETEAPESVDLSDGLVLSATDITFREAGESTYLSVTNLPSGAEVFWASSNEEVATVEPNGHVVAVGKGTCYITAVVDDYTESCIVRCSFED